jgi:hypothetical protein
MRRPRFNPGMFSVSLRLIVRSAILLQILQSVTVPERVWSEDLPGYAKSVPAEPAAARQRRHARVAERRSGILLAHRGAATLATENTLEAYAAAMDYGADGCEIDVRRCADGVLVLFHDDMLDRLTDGFGKVWPT